MTNIKYTRIEDLNRKELLAIVNKEKVRGHLVRHDQFNEESLIQWVASKTEVDSTDGCMIRGIEVDGQVAGWCGIQYENDDFELAIVIDNKFWGLGLQIFRSNMEWAKMLGHPYLVIHLLNTRPKYRFLKKMATTIYKSELFGEEYTSYKLPVTPN